MTKIVTLLSVLFLIAISGCDPTSEAAFLQGRGYNPCIEVIPACPGQFAACMLDDDNYTYVDFPGSILFITNADKEVEIEVLMYLTQQEDAGTSTIIYWNEPGCSDVYTYDSAGRNLFAEADDHIIRERKKIYKGGGHLIEINSDMQAYVDLAVRIIEPGS
ncbi:MAG: hypothetical protein JW841_00380 [Deltaproteobacteria bacterium]|nr:hypothetical protein [Deltaproteobacteria bacterium]